MIFFNTSDKMVWRKEEKEDTPVKPLYKLFPNILNKNHKSFHIRDIDLVDKNQLFSCDWSYLNILKQVPECDFHLWIHLKDKNERRIIDIFVFFYVKKNTMVYYEADDKYNFTYKIEERINIAKVKKLFNQADFIRYSFDKYLILFEKEKLTVESTQKLFFTRYHKDTYFFEKLCDSPLLLLRFSSDPKINWLPLNIMLFNKFSTLFPETDENRQFRQRLFRLLFKHGKTLNKKMSVHRHFKDIKIVSG